MSVKDSSNDRVVIAFRPRKPARPEGCRGARIRPPPVAMVWLDSAVSLTQLVRGLQGAGLRLRWDRQTRGLVIMLVSP
jgi:hypothetical protein